MKAISLLILRLGTGLLLMIWGAIKLAAPEASIQVSDTYYQSLLSGEGLQMPLGIAEVALGALVVLGLFRAIVYPLQAIVLGLGLAGIWQYILDPLGLYLLNEETRQVLFFPSLTVFAASLVLLFFREDDTISIDALRG